MIEAVEVGLGDRDARQLLVAQERRARDRAREAPATLLVEQVLDVVGAEGLAAERRVERDPDVLVAVAIDEIEDAPEVVSRAYLGTREAGDVALSLLAEDGEEAFAAVIAICSPPLRPQLAIVLRVEHVLTPRVGASVSRDALAARVDLHRRGRPLEDQAAPAGQDVRDAVCRAVEVDAEELARAHGRQHDGRVVWPLGKLEQRGSLGLLEEVARSAVGDRVVAVVRDRVPPRREVALLALEVVDPAAAALVALAQVADARLDDALVPRAARPNTRFAARSMFIDTDDLTFFDVSKALDAMTGLDYTYLEIVAEYQKRGVCMALSTEGTLIAMGGPRGPWKGGLYRAATRAFMARKNPDWRPRIGATVEKLMALGLLSRPEHREERREVVDLFGTRVERAPPSFGPRTSHRSTTSPLRAAR